ncbi:serine hydrolase [Brevundimonas terrae]|uniref:Serine hydrolase n=1 Tax=Brevundimonas terrae TaxID=363631 RepID=A0ABP3I5D8_9CAUL|nr:serine hydrolase [Brevundimonas terrae]NIJ26411.1 CubicO group peptidase (beta-lactamase class C family) [Brevundimonas terrae]
MKTLYSERVLSICVAVAALAFPAQAMAQMPEAIASQPAHQRALAAGYKALTVCSALKTAEEAGSSRTVASVEANELVGIYAELAPIIGHLVAEVSAQGVSVAWDDQAPARVATYRPGQGCVIQPMGYVSGSNLAPVTRHSDAKDLPTGAVAGDAVALERVIQSALTQGYGAGTNTTGVVVLQNGKRVAESYAEGFGPDTPQRTWSVAKSIAGTLIGAAVQRGEVKVSDRADIANWQMAGDPRAAITIESLMRMSSGLTSDTAGNRTDALYFGGTTADEQAAGWPLLHPVGSTYRYANNDTLLAVMAIAKGFEVNPPAAFFDRLGMSRTYAETDWRGNYILSSQVWTTARDLSRLGQLYLDDGVWEGERILPQGWGAFVSTPSGPQPPTGNFGYGATFWVFNRSDGVPADTYAANGNRGQYIVIIPSRRTVIVRRGEDPAGKSFDVAAFTRDVLATLD